MHRFSRQALHCALFVGASVIAFTAGPVALQPGAEAGLTFAKMAFADEDGGGKGKMGAGGGAHKGKGPGTIGGGGKGQGGNHGYQEAFEADIKLLGIDMNLISGEAGHA